jgi:translation elongation factor EF-1alpha
MTIINHQSKIYPGYLAVLHIYRAVAEVRLKKLTTLIDRKRGEETLEDPKDFLRLGRFALSDQGRTVVVGKVLAMIR